MRGEHFLTMMMTWEGKQFTNIWSQDASKIFLPCTVKNICVLLTGHEMLLKNVNISLRRLISVSSFQKESENQLRFFT